MTSRCLMGMILLMLSACTVGPDYEVPNFKTNEWLDAKSNEKTIVKWWKQFNDPVLEQLITTVVSDNLDIIIAQERITESRALRAVARAPLIPSLGGRNNIARQQQSLNNPNFPQAPQINIPQYQTIYDTGFDAAWEIDLFGGSRRALEAATARLEGTEALSRNIILSVIAETARHYVELRGHQKRLALLLDNAKLQQQTVDLLRSSYDSGLSREVDVTRAEAQLANTQAQVPNLEAEIRSASYRLALLTGQQPDPLYSFLEQTHSLNLPNELVPVGLKSDLLRRRPDIQIAERNLAASTADIGVAVADLYPSFNLTGSVGFISSESESLFDRASQTFLLSPFIKFPIFEGGRLRAQIDVTEARHSIAAVEYEQAVLNALREAESALIRYTKEQETRAKLQESLAASMRSTKLANSLYDQGLTDYIDVLDAERMLIETKEALVQSQTRVFTNLIGLYKTLGGGWEAFELQKKVDLMEPN